ncbi:MAG: hypothetical protein L6R41_004136 [Letrouitia leprolyta]|nr:MAG: hypothetical protein L6R41_004136 [Letrouitia leprolyta]
MGIPPERSQTLVRTAELHNYYKVAGKIRGSIVAFCCQFFWSSILINRLPGLPEMNVRGWMDDLTTWACRCLVENYPRFPQGGICCVPYLLCLAEPRGNILDSAIACEVEHRALVLANGYTERGGGVQAIFVLTTVGTTARLWKYSKGKEYMDPLFGLRNDLAHRSACVDAHSKDEAWKLIEGFERIIEERPAEEHLPCKQEGEAFVHASATFTAAMGEEGGTGGSWK